MEHESEKKRNELEKEEINSETKMDETSEGKEVGEVKIDDRAKRKKNKTFKVRRKQAKTYFLIRQ